MLDVADILVAQNYFSCIHLKISDLVVNSFETLPFTLCTEYLNEDSRNLLQLRNYAGVCFHTEQNRH